MKTNKNNTSEMPVRKVSFGIDIGKENFVVTSGVLYNDFSRNLKDMKSFPNTKSGADKFIKQAGTYLKRLNLSADAMIWFVMEATGIYNECLAHRLYKEGFQVHIALANKMKNFSRTLSNKSKNDKLDSQAICQYGLEKELEKWEPLPAENKRLKDLVRALINTKDKLASVKTEMEAKKHCYKADPYTMEILKQQKRFLEKQIKKIREKINNTVDNIPEMKQKINKITNNFSGVCSQTVIIILAETNNFKNVSSRKQLTSYAGLDIIQNQSGMYNGKARISKKGNNIIRRALYMPAISAIHHNKRMKNLFERVYERHGRISKKIGIVSVMRKILLIVYALWKNDSEYDINYLSQPNMSCKCSA